MSGRLWAAVGLSFGLAGCSWCGQEPKAVPRPVARAAEVRGEVRTHPPDVVVWTPLARDQVLGAGDWVRTGEASRARIVFFAGSEMVLEASATVKVEEPREEGGSLLGQIALHDGVVRGGFEEGSARPLIVGTPDGRRVVLVPSGGGIDYRLTVGGEGKVEIAITKGEARVIDMQGREVTLGAGQAQDVAEGALLGELVELVPFPELIAPGVDELVRRDADGGVALTWSAVPRAARYRVEIAAEQSFGSLVGEAVVESARFSFVPPRPGPYFWRVASRDERGREGELGFARRFRVSERRAEDLLLSPPDRAVFASGAGKAVVVFTWRREDDAAPHELVVASSEELLRSVVRTERTAGSEVRAADLAPGSYWWGVYAEREGGREPLFLRPRRLTVERAADARLRTPKSLEWR